MPNDFTPNQPYNAQKPSDDSSQSSAMAFVLRRLLMDALDCGLPAKVVAYDRESNMATIQPLIQRVSVTGEVHNRGQIYDVQCLSLGGGGFHISFPLVKGDLGWIIALDRDIDLFKQTLEDSVPNTSRNHTFADCWFVPDAMRKYVINEEDADAMVIQSVNGFCRIAVAPDQIRVSVGGTKIVATDSAVTVDAGSATVTAPEGTTFNSNVQINGTLDVSETVTSGGNMSSGGDLSASGKLTAGGGGSIGGISVEGHTHTDAEGRDTSGPNA